MIITLCGSTKFEQSFIDAQRELSRRGILCFSLAVLPQHRQPNENWSDDGLDKILADLLYFQRIQNSDAILVLGDGYVGFSTAREILWAQIQGKRIYGQRPGESWDDLAERLTGYVDDGEVLIEKAKGNFK